MRDGTFLGTVIFPSGDGVEHTAESISNRLLQEFSLRPIPEMANIRVATAVTAVLSMVLTKLDDLEYANIYSQDTTLDIQRKYYSHGLEGKALSELLTSIAKCTAVHLLVHERLDTEEVLDDLAKTILYGSISQNRYKFGIYEHSTVVDDCGREFEQDLRIYNFIETHGLAKVLEAIRALVKSKPVKTRKII
jgi:hypothetical protein